MLRGKIAKEMQKKCEICREKMARKQGNRNGGKQNGNNKRKAHFKTFSFQITCRFNLCDSTEVGRESWNWQRDKEKYGQHKWETARQTEREREREEKQNNG